MKCKFEYEFSHCIYCTLFFNSFLLLRAREMSLVKPYITWNQICFCGSQILGIMWGLITGNIFWSLSLALYLATLIALMKRTRLCEERVQKRAAHEATVNDDWSGIIYSVFNYTHILTALFSGARLGTAAFKCLWIFWLLFNW